ncbi:hypothetical protein BG015_000197 [Linnemannia schmuckeri]|uniref:Uncharacterized protein n=1 Tax=Linnemannia schmuckeri TaxID=64567 RepID=A0A9P5V7S0_9FUNG|nr:hypothetical protein BG015_000197 [Linnemannia schmuckeri]
MSMHMDPDSCRYPPKSCPDPDPLTVERPFRKRAPPIPPPSPAPLPVPTPSPIEPAPAPTDPPTAALIPNTTNPSPTSFSSPPPAAITTTATTAMATKNTTLILTSAVLGSLLLLVALLLFYVCMKRRRCAASCRRWRGRVGQLQDGMPTSSSFLDADNEKGGGGRKSSSEKYYYKHQHQYHQYPVQHQIDTTSSASTLVAHPANAHHRTRSAPIAFAFAKGGLRRHSDTSTKSNNATPMATTTVSPTTVVGGYGQTGRIGRDAFGSQFQQISLVAEEPEEDDNVSLRRSLSIGDGHGGYGYGYGFGGYGVSSSSNSSRNRCKTVAVPTPVVSTLHRSVSLSTHGHPLHGLDSGSYNHHNHYYNSRSGAPHIHDESNEDDDVEEREQLPHDADLPLPTTSRHHQLRFAEGENPYVSHSSSTFPQQQQQQPYPYPQHHIQHSNRYSVGLGYHNSHRGSISSAMEFDPSRFSTMSVMFDAKRLFTSSRPVSSSSVSAAAAGAAGGTVPSFSHPRPPTGPESDESDDDTVSTSSSDGGFDDLPPHQLSQHFESHNPYAASTTTTANGDKQDRHNGDDDGSEDESEDECDGEAVVQGLGVEVRRQHGYPVYGQTISPLALPPMPPQIDSEWPPQDK